MKHKTDFLIIGSGIAGLSYALKVAPFGKVLLLTKGDEDESNTKYAQGGIAAVMHDEDTYQKHIQDTLSCGDGLCDEEIARMVITESTQRIRELIEWGAEFDKRPGGEYDLGKEGGHSEHRIIHHKDNTGFEIERALLQQVHHHPNIEILTHHFSIDIITQHHLTSIPDSPIPPLSDSEREKGRKGERERGEEVECYGAYILNTKTNEIQTVLAKTTLLATGGAGQSYHVTTNPQIATGDGIAMVYRAKGKVENMEFVQFHPTALYYPKESPAFLITEALRGFGAILKTQDEKEFMEKYDSRGSLAPRDIVARAMDNEMKIRGDDFVYLDCRHLDKNEVVKKFPNIHKKCLRTGIDITKDFIPVAPAAHYICGGIKVDGKGKSSIKNLYAVGECARTGLHGANRLASNSLLEAVVFAHHAAEDAVQAAKNQKQTIDENRIPDWDATGTAAPEEMVLITQSLKEVKTIMTTYVGIVRSELRLKRALDRLEIIFNENESLYDKTTISQKLCELRNIIQTAYLIIKQALNRKESRGLHYMTDYPPQKKPFNK